MATSTKQAALERRNEHLVFYDGVCGLCDGFTRFLLRRDRRGVFAFVALQSKEATATLERFGRDARTLSSFYVLAHYRTRRRRCLLVRSEAALFVARELGWPWRALSVFAVLPAAWRDSIYLLVARYRYRLFGRSDECQVPTPEYRDRFIPANWRLP